MPLFREPYCSRCMLVTDDKHPGDLLDSGHIDSNIRKAIRLGADPAVAVKWQRWSRHSIWVQAARCRSTGYRADLVVVPDLESLRSNRFTRMARWWPSTENAETRTA